MYLILHISSKLLRKISLFLYVYFFQIYMFTYFLFPTSQPLQTCFNWRRAITTMFSGEADINLSLLLACSGVYWSPKNSVQAPTELYYSMLETLITLFSLALAHPWRHSSPYGLGPWATWADEWQQVYGVQWSLSSFLTQAILWWYYNWYFPFTWKGMKARIFNRNDLNKNSKKLIPQFYNHLPFSLPSISV